MFVSKLMNFVKKLQPARLLAGGLSFFSERGEWEVYIGNTNDISFYVLNRLWRSKDAQGRQFNTYSPVTKQIKAEFGLPQKERYTFLHTGQLYKSVDVDIAEDFVTIRYKDNAPDGKPYDTIFDTYGGGARNVMGAIWSAEDKDKIIANIINYLRNG